MRIIHLSKCYFYQPITKKEDGEIITEWKLKEEYMLNKQQDINELDKNSSGMIDYERVKLRTTKNIEVEKGMGVSFSKLEENEKPAHLVISHTIVGSSHLIICETYNGS